MKDVVKTGSGAMIYIPGFTKTDSGIQTLMGWERMLLRHAGSMQIT
jgi:hypothetical protein